MADIGTQVCFFLRKDSLINNFQKYQKKNLSKHTKGS